MKPFPEFDQLAPAIVETVVQCSSDCVKILDANGFVLFFNENGLCAMEIATVRGKYWPDLWPASQRPNLEQTLKCHEARIVVGAGRLSQLDLEF
jgi:hypothetical protein